MFPRYVALCATIALCCCPARATDVAPKTDLRCGTFCLYVALRAIDLGPPTFEELEKKAGPPGPLGYSMLQLEELARGEGARTIAVESNLEKLHARPEPFACIALLNHNHFVVLHNADDRLAYFVDPPIPKSLPVDTFNQAWTKKALLIGRGPLRSEESVRLPIRWGRALAWASGVSAALVATLLAVNVVRRRFGDGPKVMGRLGCLLALALGPGIPGCGGVAGSDPAASGNASALNPASLVVEPAEHLLGDILRASTDATLETKTTLRNVGGEPLEIGTIRIGCTCTAASLSRDLIPPGETATLTASIKIGDSPMPRDSALTIFNSSPDRPSVTVGFRWRAVNRVRVEPPTCEWSRLRRGETASRTVEVIANGIGLCPTCRVEFTPSSEFLSADVTPGGDIRVGHEAPSGATSNRTIAHLVVRARGSGELGPRGQDSIVSIRCGEEERARVALPGSWTVSTPVEVSPERLSLGSCRPGDRIERKIVLGSDDGTPFRVGRVACERDGVINLADHAGDAKARHIVGLTFEVPKADGPWRTELVIETDRDDARRLVIPVSAMVQARP